MALESGSFIDDLVDTNPLGTDAKNKGDDHLRLVKKVVKATFPGMAGEAWRVQAKSGAYTVVVNDNMTAINCTAALTLSLTAAATLGNKHLFFVIANGGAVTIDPDGAETINGASTIVIADGDRAIVFCDGTLFLAAVIAVASGPTKEFFALATGVDSAFGYGNAVGDFQVAEIGTAASADFNFHIPNDFTSLTDAVVVVIPDTTETNDFDVTTDFGAVGEAHTANSDSITGGTFSATLDQLGDIDVSAALTAIAAGDYVGMRFESNTDSIRPFLLRIRYS